MSDAARPRPRTSRHDTLKPLTGRELDARDLRFVTSIVRKASATELIGYEEALSAGLIAYWLAARRYDPDTDAAWTTFCWPRVHGAIIDEARREDHLSRWHRRAVNAGDLTAPIFVGLDEPDLKICRASDNERVLISDTLAAADEGDHDLRLTVDAALEILHVADARIAAVLRLYYEQGWRDEDIGVLFGVSVSRISQLRDAGRGMLAELLPLDLLDAA